MSNTDKTHRPDTMQPQQPKTTITVYPADSQKTTEQKLAETLKKVEKLKAKLKAGKAAAAAKKKDETVLVCIQPNGDRPRILTMKRKEYDAYCAWMDDRGMGDCFIITKEDLKIINLKDSSKWMDDYCKTTTWRAGLDGEDGKD